MRRHPIHRLKTTDWAAIFLAKAVFPAPAALDIRAVAPWEMPELTAMRMKKTGKDSDRAASASVDRRPAK
jgi:hypothetical protein